MKRLAFILSLVLLLCLWGCDADRLPAYSGSSAYLIETEYFTLPLLGDLQGKCEYSMETFVDGTYELILYQKDGLTNGNEIFNIRLFPRFQVADNYFIEHGILVTPKGDYQLASRLPEGVDNTPENKEVCDDIVKDFYGIANNLTPNEGCELLVPQLEVPPEEVEDIVIETAYYTLTLPVDFYNNCELQIFPADEEGPDALVLYELSSFKTDYGGHLCSILLIPHGEDYDFYPAYEWLGVLETPEGDFDIVVLYPTDVQFSEDTAAEYNRLVQYVEDVLYSLRPKDGIGLALP